MRILLDTCTFIWVSSQGEELSSTAKECFLSDENQFYLSSASVWEITVKYQMGKLSITESPHLAIPKACQLNKIHSLPFSGEDALRLLQLPNHHRDPFDRMLICQAIQNGLILLTPDPWIQRYPIRTLW